MLVTAPEWKTFDPLYALSSFADAWEENEKLIQKAAEEEEKKWGPRWTPKAEEDLPEYQMEIRNARHLHDEILTPTFRYSSVVMLYTIVERELRRTVENLEKERGLQKLKVNDIREASFLGQVAKFIDAFYGVKLVACPQYSALCDLQKIRHCITHCRGEISLSQDKVYLLKLPDRRPGFFAWEGTDIQIEPECIKTFIAETWACFTWLFGELKWPIDDTWKDNKWMKSQGANKAGTSHKGSS